MRGFRSGQEAPMKLIEVSKAFATDEQCLAYLENRRWPDGVRCTVCGGKEVSKITRKTRQRTSVPRFTSV